MQADVLAAGQFIGRVTGRDGAPGLFVRANLGDDLHDIATLLSDADDPVVMWPSGVGQIARPSNPAGPPRRNKLATSEIVDEEGSSRSRTVRSAPPILQTSEEPEPEPPIGMDAEVEEPELEQRPPIEHEAPEPQPTAEAEVEVEAPALPALDLDQLSNDSHQSVDEADSDEDIELPADVDPGSPSSASMSPAGHRLAAKRERPAPASKRRSR